MTSQQFIALYAYILNYFQELAPKYSLRPGFRDVIFGSQNGLEILETLSKVLET